jgi:hypothetical protein
MLRVALKSFVCLSLLFALACWAQNRSPQETTMHHATGSFDVKVAPVTDDFAKSAGIARMTLDKQFHGDLEGAGKGEMLSAGDPSKGSAGYVAMEQVTGTLHGRSGSFALQHSATLTGSKPQMTITVVPGSGTGHLAGISGSMNIKIEGGKHSYELEYDLPELSSEPKK